MSPMQFSSSFSMEPSSSQVTETPASSVPNTQAIDAPTKANAGVLSATGLTKHDVDGSAPVPKLKSAKWVSKAKLNTSFTLYDESQAQKSNPETSLPVSTTTDTPTLPASLKRAASQPRLHTSLDGSVRIKTADSPTPSPPRSQTDNPTRQPRNSGPLQRSQSAFVAPTFAAPGRSRDSRTWAFYCDSEARDELTKQAEREQSGSAVGAIGLIRSRSKGSFAATNKNNKRASSSVDAKKPSKKAQTSALAKRRANTLGAVKSTHPFVNQIIKDPSLGITNDRPKTDGKKKAITEFDTELDGNESDKENWAPGTQTVVSPVRRQTHRPANLPSARVLRDNSGIPSTSTSLGTMLGRSATSTPTLEKGKVTNPVKRNRLGVTKDEKEKPAKQGPEVNDDVKNMTEEKGKEEVSAKEEDLSCVQGLLSLSQGEWR
ncbi:MAG: hypothetical protein LQ350_004041 [Teloschistes chrysophthalmus]|nr:MAG: hypothetical protein LQ350_004041 [Niorma chrysophthalma]